MTDILSAAPYEETPSQTVGPYFAYGLVPGQYGYAMRSLAGAMMADDTVPGERIIIEGRVLDANGDPVTDALIEFWQADADGLYSDIGSNNRFTGFGRCGTGTDPDARFCFETIKPGATLAQEAEEQAGPSAPHINVTVMMRGLLVHVFTRLYFDDEAAANDRDPLLRSVPDDRRATLVARRIGHGRYTFDIRMQGEGETVFFDI